MVVFGLVLARIGTWALFRVFLPTLLTLLSLFFGRGLRRAAWRCRDIGVQGDRGLVHAMDAVRGRILGRTEIEVDPEPEGPDESDGREGDSPSPIEPTPRTRVRGGRSRVDGAHAPSDHEEGLAELEDPDDPTDQGRREQR